VVCVFRMDDGDYPPQARRSLPYHTSIVTQYHVLGKKTARGKGRSKEVCGNSKTYCVNECRVCVVNSNNTLQAHKTIVGESRHRSVGRARSDGELCVDSR